MKLKIIFLVLASILSVPHYAAVVEPIAASGVASLPVKNVGYSTDGVYNYKTFCVEAPAERDYFTQFWLLPARYADNTYTPFYIYVNGEYADCINVSSGNWQVAEPAGDGRLHLVEGTNFVSVATRAPEAPDVETVKVAEYFQDAAISSLAYDDYLARAKKSSNTNTVAESVKSSYQNYEKVHLLYSFYQRYYMPKNRILIIETSSKVPHDVDVFFYGYSYIKIPELESPLIIYPMTVDTSREKKYISDSIAIAKLKYSTNTEKMQGYNWKGVSEKSNKTGLQTIKLQMSAPEDGHYFIRFRTRANEQAGVVDVSINGKYFFDSVAVNYVYRDVKFPADNSIYSAYTITKESNHIDPILFIHGNDGDRVVGFNDDDQSEYPGENKYDSYIEQTYHVPTTRISMSNMGSLIPDTIFSTLIAGSADTYSRRQRKVTTAAVASPEESIGSIEISNVANNDSPIIISSPKPITKVSVYTLIGRLLYSGSYDSSRVVLPISVLNLSGAGIFIVSASTTDETSSKKVLIK